MVAESLIAWYNKNKRELPWRQTSDPYYIWLSEIILQQTRVEQGKPYYFKFIEAFPTVEKLATAEEQEVLRLWQGLGYYSRARNLHFTAKYIHFNLRGEFPKTYDQLLELRGVGPYTAAAIASFAFGEARAVVDGNVYRVLSRLYDEKEPINSNVGSKLFQKLADQLLDLNRPALFNQAVMELGSQICKPKSPLCDQCPINLYCQAKKVNTIQLRPQKEKKIKVKNRFFQYLVFRYEDKILLKKRSPGDIWQGMYDFPLVETESINGEKDVMEFLSSHNIKAKLVLLKENRVHLLTHQRIQANFWEIDLKDTFVLNNGNFFSKVAIELLPKPKLIVNYIQNK